MPRKRRMPVSPSGHQIRASVPGRACIEDLLRERQVLVVTLAAARAKANDCLAALHAVEKTILLVGRDNDLSGAAPYGIAIPYDEVFRPGDIIRITRAVLRDAACPLCTVEVASAVLKRCGSPLLSRADRKRLLQSVYSVLSFLCQRGDVERMSRIRRLGMGAAGSVLWRPTDPPSASDHG